MTSITVKHPDGLNVTYSRFGVNKISGLKIEKQNHAWQLSLENADSTVNAQLGKALLEAIK